MTEDRMALIEAIQKADDGNFLRALAETVLQIIMDADGRGADRRRPARTLGRPTDLSQRLSRPDAGDAARWAQPAHPEAPPGIVLSRLSGAAENGGEGIGVGPRGGGPEGAPGLDDSERRAILGRNAARLLGIEVPRAGT